MDARPLEFTFTTAFRERAVALNVTVDLAGRVLRCTSPLDDLPEAALRLSYGRDVPELRAHLRHFALKLEVRIGLLLLRAQEELGAAAGAGEVALSNGVREARRQAGLPDWREAEEHEYSPGLRWVRHWYAEGRSPEDVRDLWTLTGGGETFYRPRPWFAPAAGDTGLQLLRLYLRECPIEDLDHFLRRAADTGEPHDLATLRAFLDRPRGGTTPLVMSVMGHDKSPEAFALLMNAFRSKVKLTAPAEVHAVIDVLRDYPDQPEATILDAFFHGGKEADRSGLVGILRGAGFDDNAIVGATQPLLKVPVDWYTVALLELYGQLAREAQPPVDAVCRSVVRAFDLRGNPRALLAVLNRQPAAAVSDWFNQRLLLAKGSTFGRTVPRVLEAYLSYSFQQRGKAGAEFTFVPGKDLVATIRRGFDPAKCSLEEVGILGYLPPELLPPTVIGSLHAVFREQPNRQLHREAALRSLNRLVTHLPYDAGLDDVLLRLADHRTQTTRMLARRLLRHSPRPETLRALNELPERRSPVITPMKTPSLLTSLKRWWRNL